MLVLLPRALKERHATKPLLFMMMPIILARVYAASEIVALSPLRAYVLDGGENRLLTSYSPSCEPDTGACSAQRITIQHSPDTHWTLQN